MHPLVQICLLTSKDHRGGWKESSAYRRAGNQPPCPSGAAIVLVPRSPQVTRPPLPAFHISITLAASEGTEDHYLFKKKLHSLDIGQEAYCLPFQSHARTLNKPPEMLWDPLGKGSFVRLTSYYWLGLRLCTQMLPCRRSIWCKWRLSRRHANHFCHLEKETEGPNLFCFLSYVEKCMSVSHNYLLANDPLPPFPH